VALALIDCGVSPPSAPIVLDASNTIDTNSLAPGYLGDPSWQCDPQGTDRPYFTASAELGPDGLTGYVVEANPGRLVQAAAGAIFGPSWSRFFVAPEAETFGAIVASVDIKAPPGAPVGTVKITITDPNETVIFQTASLTTSGAWQTLSTGSQALIAGHRYVVRVYVSGTHALLGRVAVRGSAPSDAWWSGTIKRQSVHPQNLADNSFPVGGDARGGGLAPISPLSPLHYYYADPDSSYSFTFDGTRFAVELYTSDNQFGRCGLDVLVNGVLFTKVQGVNLLNTDVAAVTGLPAGVKTISIRTFVQRWLVNYDLVDGCWLNAVYTDSADTMTPLAPPAIGGGVVLFGTSKVAGFDAGGNVPSGDPSALGLIAKLRAGQPKRVIGKAIGSVSLYAEFVACSPDGSYTGGSIMPLARDIIGAKPSVFLIEGERNDCAGGLWPSIAAWSTQYQLLLDTVQDALPSCAIWMIYTTNETTPLPNIGLYEAEQDAICAARPRIQKMDLRNTWSSADAHLHTVDGVHPDSPDGYDIVAAYMLVRI
jgi:hypothetical protein